MTICNWIEFYPILTIMYNDQDYDYDFFFQLYVLDDTDPPSSPAKKTSRELAGTLRNLKKVEQALQALECANYVTDGDAFEDDVEEEEEDGDDGDDEENENVVEEGGRG